MENDQFNTPSNEKVPKGGIMWRKSMIWLFIITGLFIVCLLIWVVTAFSHDEADGAIETPQPTEQVVNTNSNPAATPIE